MILQDCLGGRKRTSVWKLGDSRNGLLATLYLWHYSISLQKKKKIFSLPEGNVPLLQSSSVPWIYKAWWQTPSISNSQEIPCCQSPTWSDFCTTTFLKLGALRKRHLQQPTRKIDDYLKSTTVKLKDLAMIKQRIFSWGLNTLTKKSEKVFSITLMDKNCEHKMLTTLKRKNNNTKRKNNNVYC